MKYQITLKDNVTRLIHNVASVKTDPNFVHLLDSAGNNLFSFQPHQLIDLQKINAQANTKRKSFRQLNEVDKATIVKLRSEGKLYREISAILGFNENTIAKYGKRVKIVCTTAKI